MRSARCIRCEFCSYKGWVHPKRDGDGANICPICKGNTSVTLYALGKRIGEHPETMTRLARLKLGGKAGQRLFVKLAWLMEASS